MAVNFQNASNQGSILYNFSSSHNAGEEIRLTTASGVTLASFSPEKSYQSVVISCPSVQDGETYLLSAGSETAEITMSGMLYGSGMGFGGRMGFAGGEDFGGGDAGFGSDRTGFYGNRPFGGNAASGLMGSPDGQSFGGNPESEFTPGGGWRGRTVQEGRAWNP